MEFLVGTSGGLFAGGAGTPVEGLSSSGIRHISKIGSDLFAGAAGGVYRSSNGLSWKLAGVEGPEIWDIVSAPGDPRTIYAGTQPLGLHQSSDGGSTWTPVETFLRAPGADRWCLPGQPPPSARARTLVFDAQNPLRFHVGVEVGGVASSSDGGSSWEVSLPGGNPDIHVMVAHPGKANVIFATTGFGRIDNSEPQEKRIAGAFRSDDAGKSWTYLWEGMQPPYTRPICIDPRAPHALTVACAPTAFSSMKNEGGAKAMLYRSDDDGANWRSLGDALHSPSTANFLSVTPDAERAGWVLVGTEAGEVWRVSPEGSWSLLTEGLPAVQALLALA
jgi:hypothetical protein